MNILHLAFHVIILVAKVISDNIDPADFPELLYLDRSVNPCDDFYTFSCGNFKQYHPRPVEDSTINQYTLLESSFVDDAKNILSSDYEETDAVAVKKAKMAYKACINYNFTKNFLHLPEMSIMSAFSGMPLLINGGGGKKLSLNDIGDLESDYGVPIFFMYSIYSYSFLPEPSPCILILNDYSSDPTLHRSEYKKTMEQVITEDLLRYRHLKQKKSQETSPFAHFLKYLLMTIRDNTNMGITDSDLDKGLEDLANFVEKLDANQLSSSAKQYSVRDLQQSTLEKFGQDIDLNWLVYLNKVFKSSSVKITEDTKVCVAKDDMMKILEVINQTDRDVIKNFAMLRIFLYTALDSTDSIRQMFQEYSKAKNIKLYSREEYCARKVLDLDGLPGLSFAVAHHYEKYYFDKNKYPKAMQILENLAQAFQNILNSSWMDDESKIAVIKKLDNLRVLLALPNKFVKDLKFLDEFYENLRICEWDNYGNSLRIRALKQAYQLSSLNYADRPSFWSNSPFATNAYNERGQNKIEYPLGMMNPTFFKNKDDVFDYAQFGSILGHEIMHSFDKTGILYDQNGTINGWLSDETSKTHTNKSSCFENQYNEYYIPEIDSKVDGSYTLDENLADNIGVRISYQAFLNSHSTFLHDIGKEFTAEQLFFIGYTTNFCEESSEEYLRDLQTTHYAPSRYRTIGPLSNMNEFSEAFSCPTGSRMNPAKKCNLW